MNPMIWFDDGFKSTITVAYPIMKKFGLTGIIPVITNRVGKTSLLTYGPKDVRELPLMGIEDLKFLIEEGWEIASHSLTHPIAFDKLTMEQTDYELRVSKFWIFNVLNVNVTKFVVPKHLIRLEQIELVKKYYSYIRPIPPLPLPENREKRTQWFSQHIKFHWIESEGQIMGALKAWKAIK